MRIKLPAKLMARISLNEKEPHPKDIIHKNRIEWSAHALSRMLEKGISRASVKYIITNGEMMENYPDDKPFPSGLFHG